MSNPLGSIFGDNDILNDALDDILSKSSAKIQQDGTPYEKCCDTLETLKRQLADKEAE